jgi:hypothetical protein
VENPPPLLLLLLLLLQRLLLMRKRGYGRDMISPKPIISVDVALREGIAGGVECDVENMTATLQLRPLHVNHRLITIVQAMIS